MTTPAVKDGMQILISGDFNAFNSGFNGNGVYMASGVAPSESFPRPIYIGSAGSNGGFKDRIQKGHIKRLERGCGSNRPMQAYASRYGVSSLVWFLVEECSPAAALEREQHYLDALQPFAVKNGGFNILPKAGSPLGYKHTEETKKRIGNASRGKPRSEETRRKVSAAQKGKPNKGREKTAIARRKTVWFTHERSQETVKAEGIRTFAIARGLHPKHLSSVATGKLRQSQGWRLATPLEIQSASVSPLSPPLPL